MGVVIFLYILLIIGVVCFLLKLFIKYFDIQFPEQVKGVIYKIPKAQQTIEKFQDYLKKARISETLSSVVSNMIDSLQNLKSRNRMKENVKIANEPVIRAQVNLNGTMDSDIGNSSLNNNNFQPNKNFFDRSMVKRTEEEQKIEDRNLREQNVIQRESVRTSPIGIINNITSNVPLAAANGVPNSSFKPLPDSNVKNVANYSSNRSVDSNVSSNNTIQRPPVMEKGSSNKQSVLERLAAEKVLKEERADQIINRLDKVKPKKKKYDIVQTGYASVFLSRSSNMTIIPYARDIQGKGRAMDAIMYLKYPIMPDELGRAVKNSINIGSDVYPYSDKELLKKFDVKEWSDYTCEKRHLSIKYDTECGYILNTTTRNPDGSYRLNCPGGVEKIVRKDASLEELGDTVLKLMERCKF